MRDLRPEYEAARILARQSSLSTGIWVRELELGVPVIFDTVENYRRICKSDSVPAVEGCAVRGDCVALILYSHGWDVHRINYTLAHEVGHIILGHSGGPEDESEANRFASALTVPFAPLRALGRVSAHQVAEFFGCSLSAASVALRRANVVSPYDGEVMRLFRERLEGYTRGRNPLDISYDL